jgi:hypothetical protein
MDEGPYSTPRAGLLLNIELTVISHAPAHQTRVTNRNVMYTLVLFIPMGIINVIRKAQGYGKNLLRSKFSLAFSRSCSYPSILYRSVANRQRRHCHVFPSLIFFRHDGVCLLVDVMSGMEDNSRTQTDRHMKRVLELLEQPSEWNRLLLQQNHE